MKTLYLVRHAKSSWSFDLPDHDRPLGKRGRKDVLKMSKYLTENISPPEMLITSTASRALYTALYLCDRFDMDEDEIILDKNLFHASPKQILHVIRAAPQCDTLAIFGHNPGFTDCANLLANTNIENMPTCGIVGISLKIDKWNDLQFGMGKKEFFHYPKGIK